MSNSTAQEVPPSEECSDAPVSEAPQPEPEELSVRVKNVTITYRAYNERPGTLKELALNYISSQKKRYYTTFEALSDVSFSVPKGKIVGFIGSNGAGKSTLLKVLSGVLKPSQGEVITQGRVDSLIKLGAGFDRELNAIENIYLYASLYQVSREEIEERVPKILEFAELEEFAHTPIRYYSSGMYARLGFSCAIDMNPDILLVDEVLAVGDERFNKKSREKMLELMNSGKTIVMVSHNIGMIQKLAHQVGVLSKGKLLFFGDPKEAVQCYRADTYESALDGKRLKKS